MPAPANDNFASASVLFGESGYITGTTFDATKEATETNFGFSTEQSVWYYFDTPTTGWYKFWIEREELIPHPSRSLFFSLASNDTLIASTFANCMTECEHPESFFVVADAVLVGYLTADIVYRIRIASARPGSINSGTIDFTLRWEPFTPPANDNFADAIDLGAPPFTETLSNLNSTSEAGELSIGGTAGTHLDQSTWWKFTPDTTGWHEIRSLRDTLVLEGHHATGTFGGLEYFPGSCQFSLGIADDFNDITSATRLVYGTCYPQMEGDNIVYKQLTASQQYYIKVHHQYRIKATGNGLPQTFNAQNAACDLQITYVTPPVNDDFADAIALSTTLPGTLTGITTQHATFEATETHIGSGNDAQSIWYTFTPTTTGRYRFRVPFETLEPYGEVEFLDPELYMALSAGTTLATFENTTLLPGPYQYESGFPIVGWQNPHTMGLEADLTASTTYHLMFHSPYTGSGAINTRNVMFDLEWDLVIPPANDDFADAITLTGASGTYDFLADYTSGEVDEPLTYNWNSGYPTETSLWFNWTCPSTGYYKLTVESLRINVNHYVEGAVYTGTAVNALTPVTKNYPAGRPTAANPASTSFKMGFHATNAVTYRIQLGIWGTDNSDDCRITWEPLPDIEGDTTADAVALPVAGRYDNFAHTDNELPPNAATLLAAHDEWNYTDGRPAKSKWFVYTAAEDEVFDIYSTQWLDNDDQYQGIDIPEMGLIAYKGANYASLTVATSTTAENVAMMLEYSPFDEGHGWTRPFTTISGKVRPKINMLSGEKLWICLFGVYDNDYGGGPEDSPETEIDLLLGYPFPNNTYISGIVDIGDDYEMHAAAVDGTTRFGIAEDNEPAHAGYGPTRSVWYTYYPPWQGGDFRIWVESDVDCVLSVYNLEDFSPENMNDLGTVLGEDDDSGPGDQPEVIINDLDDPIYIAVDSKTEGDFTLKIARLSTGTPPANDDFANAQEVPYPFAVSGTTVGATGEPYEYLSDWQSVGATDGVWYKFTATHTGTVLLRGKCLSRIEDWYLFAHVFEGESLETLTLVSVDSELEGYGQFFWGNDENDNDSKLTFPVVNGNEYYIRIATWSGGSEDFEIYLDATLVNLNLTASGSDEFHGTFYTDGLVPLRMTPLSSEIYDPMSVEIDFATVYVDLRVTSVNVGPYTDATTVPLRILPITTYEEPGVLYTDVTTVRFALTPLGGECYSTYSAQLLGEGEADLRWLSSNDEERWAEDDELRWSEGDVTLGEGIHC